MRTIVTFKNYEKWNLNAVAMVYPPTLLSQTSPPEKQTIEPLQTRKPLKSSKNMLS